MKGQVLYELHVGTFTPEGTYDGVRARLPELRELGVTAIELMPLHAFPGRFNWGYDGVDLYAPYAGYGTPDQLRELVDAAHAQGLGVLLDVVYNHLGPDGNYLRQYSEDYFSKRHPGEWGEPLNFDGERAEAVRDFVVQNGAYWVSEFHFDGLRLDATQSIFDDSKRHVLTELSEKVRGAAAQRSVLLIAENEPQDVACLQSPEAGGHGLDGLWVDDFHHTARVAATGSREAYLQDYRGSAQELLSCALRSSLFAGQWYEWQKKPRGSSLAREPAERMIFFLQNHDQVSNALRGDRLQKAGLSQARALTTFFLLLPQTPMLFMGQELFADSPFLYFVDHTPELLESVKKGRSEFLAQFPSAKAALAEGYPFDISERARDASRLEPPIGTRNEAWELHRTLLQLRKTDPLFARQSTANLAGAVLTEHALALRFCAPEESPDQRERLVLLNLGSELRHPSMAEPLLAPPRGMHWKLLLSSEEIRFGGSGGRSLPTEGPWVLPGRCALVLTSEKQE